MEPRVQIVDSKFQETILYLTWKTPEVRHKDIPVLEVLSMILGYGESSRLNQALRIEKALANSVSSEIFASIDPGFFSISLTLDKENLKDCLSCIKGELDDFYKKTPTEEEINKAIVNLQSEDFYFMETVNGVARKVGFYLQLFGDHRYHEEYLRQVQEVTCSDVMRVFRDYIRPQTLNFVFTTLNPSDESKKRVQEWVKEFQKVYEENQGVASEVAKENSPVTQMKWEKGSNGEGKFERIELSSGASLILRPNYETPLVSLRCAVLGGLRAQEDSEEGMTELLSRVWTAGTHSLSEMDMYRKIDKFASSLSAFGGRNSIGLSMQTLSSFWEPMYEIFEDTWLNPLLSELSVEREKTMMLNVVKTREDRPAQEALRVFHENLFEDHPYSKDLYGHPSTIKDLNAVNLKGFLSRSRRNRKVHVVICGAIPNRDEIIKSFERAIGLSKSDSSQSGLSNLGASQDKPHKYPESPQKWFVPSQKEQAHLIVGYPGLNFLDPRRYSLGVIQALLSGQGGRLFMELRDKASLAYSVSTLRLDGIDAGYFGGYIACSPEKVDTAISMMKDEFRKLAEEKVSERELELSKRYLLGKHDIDLQKNSSISSEILFDEMYGLLYDETFHFKERLASVTREDLRLLASEIFSKPEVLSLAGPSCPKSFIKAVGKV